ncbi:DUF4012 domain-containing protein [Candidatus Falkowbacteria bacterium]|nr:DUF4012 domain-containing protein [Patescibacteria group bacterium]MDD3435245.1 DUF4012 domain-containing protein [Patescibacteria group bacterium]MDD4466787.1 DUF4012 domain-containing protein [Patescibacteria group bacterium]NCU42863.1 DUF4012 domain-containing protein [Candidatus Falkowbacteria bacterium]
MKKGLKNTGRIIVILILAFLAILIFFALSLSNKLGASQDFYRNLTKGKNNLETAFNLVQGGSYLDAKLESDLATLAFKEALANLEDIKNNKVAANFAPVSVSLDDLEYLTKTVEILSRSFSQASLLLENLSQSSLATHSFGDLAESEKQETLALLYQAAPELKGLKANLGLALLNLDQIHRVGILLPFEAQISDLKEKLNTANNLLTTLSPLAQMLPGLAGYPEESVFLLVLQNNDELRPSGGFIGTYGLIKVKNGSLGEIITEDVYHLDMPCIDKLFETPPEPVAKYMKVKYWWLRDANWSPDWPTAARQVQKMYLNESACTGPTANQPVAVLAINPGLISRLLDFVGPITVGEDVYTSENFQSLLQYNVEIAYAEQEISSWDRKEIINEIVSELKERLFTIPLSRFSEVLEIMDEAKVRRDLQIYFNDANYQNLISGLGWGGEIKKPSHDYLMVIDANLAAYKTDAVMRKNINYQISGDQRLVATIKLDYHHEGGFDWRTTRYRSYTRILAPRGSELIDHSGLTDFSVTTDEALDKTVFGFFWSIEPGTKKEISLSYYLPEKINSINYELYFQKQSGSRLNNFSYQNETLKKYWSGTLDRDKLFK